MRKAISQLNMLSPEEYRHITCGLNDTAADYPKNKCVHTLFEEQVTKTPDKTAVIACDRELTYGELNEQANRIAHSLIAKGIQPGDIVAFMLPRRSYLLSVMFGILKSGAAYMPIDPDYPQDRIDYMLSDSGAKICITEEYLPEILGSEHIDNPHIQIASGSPCYCIYTSGSTGKPKGTSLSHKNVANFCTTSNANHFARKFISKCLVVAATNLIAFDIVLQELHLPLLNGIPVILLSAGGYLNNWEFSLLSRHKAIGLITTPVKIKLLMLNHQFCEALKKMSIIMIGADILDSTLVRQIHKFTDAEIINGYGPTETTCGVSYGAVDSRLQNSTNGLLYQISILSPKERKEVLIDFNNTAAEYPKEKCIHSLFEEQAAKDPDKVAVIACDRELTYGELNEQANRIAHSLIGMGIQPGDIVAFMLPRRSYLLSVMFGILKSGAAYLPIDPDYPQDRIDYMLSDSGAKLCITEDNLPELLANERMDNPNVQMTSQNYYCALHTSGSTGKPKLSLLRHCNLQNFIHGNKQFFENVQISVSATIVTFDAFILDTVIPLCLGIPTRLLSNEEIYNQALFEEAFMTISNAIFFSTPTKLQGYLKGSRQGWEKNVSSFVVGGELFPEELYELTWKSNANANVFNIYGPTEDTICIAFDKIEEVIAEGRANILLCQISVLSPRERKEVLTDFNNTAAEYPKEKCVHTLFEEQAANTPEKTAVITCDRELTYGELNEQANRIAHSLIARGIQPGDIVAFMLSRKSYLLSVMFGILKSGAAYLPIDPDYPQDRIDYMLSDSGAKLCITEDNLPELLANENTENPNVQITSNHPCYCIYTSGSTGKPKGALISHRNVANFCTSNDTNHFARRFMDQCSVVVSTNSIAFDIVLQELHLPLLNGLPVLLLSSGGYLNGQELDLLCKHTRVGFITTPVKIKLLMQNDRFCHALKRMSVIMIGADVLTQAMVDQVAQLTGADIINGYGPTETTCGITYSLVTK